MNKIDFHNNLKTASDKLIVDDIDTVIRDSIRPLVDTVNDAYNVNKVDGIYNLVVVMEELGELTQEISRFIRGKDNHEDLLEELADNWLGLRYVQQICGITDEELNKAINVKTERQRKRNEKKMSELW